MSASEASTLPNTPPSFHDDVLAQPMPGVFARLLPVNYLAHEAFDTALNKVIRYSDDYEHVRKFFYAESRVGPAASVFSDDDCAENDDQHAEPGSSEQWNGGFMLNLDILPRRPAEGWFLGSKYRDVDLLLAPSLKERQESYVAGKHAKIYFHNDSGRIMIEAFHTITIGVPSGSDTFSKSTRRVLEDGSLLTIGNCVYVFKSTDHFKGLSFQQNLTRFMRDQYANKQWMPNERLAQVSTGETIKLGNYVFSQGAFAQGTFGQVAAGWATDGRPVAIKKIKRPVLSTLREHEALMASLGCHVSYRSLFSRFS